MGKCKKCKKIKPLTRHSKTGGHQPPFKGLCRECHDEEHGIVRKIKQNKKVQPGTRSKRRKKQ